MHNTDAVVSGVDQGTPELVRPQSNDVEVDEHRRTKEQLRHMSHIVEAVADAIVVTDTNGIIQMVNPAFSALSGYSAEEAIGKRPSILKSGVHGSECYEEMWRTISGGCVWQRDMVDRHKNGRFVHTALTISPIFDERGECEGYVGVHRDVTMEREAERQLRLLNEDLRIQNEIVRTLQSATDIDELIERTLRTIIEMDELDGPRKAGVFLIDDDRKNLRLVGTCGEFPQEFLDSESSIPVGACLCGRAAKTGELLICDDCDFDERHEHRFEGMESHGHYIIPLKAASEVLGVLFLYTDRKPSRDLRRTVLLETIGGQIGTVIARLRAEERIRTAKTFLEIVIDTAATAVITVDVRRKITSINRAFTMITGYTEADVIGHHCSVLQGELCWDECCLHEQEQGKRMFKQQCSIRSKDGRELTIIKNADLTHDENGCVTGGVESFVDVTELVEARRAAEAATRAKSGFLANMSHEIRTPMTAILGFTEQLLDPELSESGRLNAILTVRRNGEHLLQLINDILDVSKIEAGKLDVEQVRCSPVQLVSDVKSLMEVRARAKNLTLDVEWGSAIPETIESDPMRLRQILVNLVGNAIKFTESGYVRLAVRFDPNTDTGPFMAFDIIDTGIGMTPEQASWLFEPFAQGDASTTREYGGTGLGLAISKHLANLLGGDIEFECSQDRGTTFHVRVSTGPISQVRMLEHPSITIQEVDSRPARTDDIALDVRILLAEDGPDNQRLISFVLAKAGADVSIAENGKIAVELAMKAKDQGEPFDVILMDMQMPAMDGYQATSLLRRKGYTGPIIALTAHAMATDRKRCIGAGCDDYATKPIDRSRLVGMCAEYAGKNQIRNMKETFTTDGAPTSGSAE